MDGYNHIQSEERTLARAAGEGCADSFERLITPLQRPMYACALRMTCDPHKAEDLCQDAFIKAFRSIGGFTGNSALSTWLYRILHNTWLDQVKKAGRQAVDLRDQEGDEAIEELPAMTREAVVRFTEQRRTGELREQLTAALETLSTDLKAVVVLRDIHGCSYEEVSEVVGVPIGTVKSRLARARTRLRHTLTLAGNHPATTAR